MQKYIFENSSGNSALPQICNIIDFVKQPDYWQHDTVNDHPVREPLPNTSWPIGKYKSFEVEADTSSFSLFLCESVENYCGWNSGAMVEGMGNLMTLYKYLLIYVRKMSSHIFKIYIKGKKSLKKHWH